MQTTGHAEPTPRSITGREGSAAIRTAVELGHAIRGARHDLGLTQQEAADRLGITRTTLIGLERGARGISHLTVLHVLAELGLTLTVTPAAAPDRRGQP